MYYGEKIPSGWCYKKQSVVPDGEHVELTKKQYDDLVSEKAILDQNGNIVYL